MKYKLLSTGNTKLKKDGIASINLTPILSCPGAGECKSDGYCFALCGLQAMGNAKLKRINALKLWQSNPDEFLDTAYHEIVHSRYPIIRWHDSGDIPSINYLLMMTCIARALPHVQFYAYTKSIPFIIKYQFKDLPHNLKIIQSQGGIYDHLIDYRLPHAIILQPGQPVPKGYHDASKSDLGPALYQDRIALYAHGQRKNRFKSTHKHV